MRGPEPEAHDLAPSHGQEQLWFIDQLAPGRSVYNLAFGVRLRGDLVVPALERALDDLVARHEALRTRLVSVHGRPRQVIDPPRAVTPAFDDLSQGQGDPEARLREMAAEEAARPFDLAAGPLLRSRLVRLAPAEHVLLVCVHHTVFDGWSFGVFVRELAALYEARSAGRTADLPELPVQFADYALWEREWLRGEALERLVAYWRSALDGVSTVQMPTDRPRPLLQRFDGGLERIHVDASVLDGLRALGRREGTTLFVVLLAAVQVLAHRYSGQDDVTVGIPIANRGRPELTSLIGYLVNTLAIRTDLSGDPAFVELLQRVRATTIEAYQHQALPFAALVAALEVERDPSRAPLFQLGFSMAEDHGEDIPAGSVRIRPETVDILPAKVDLNFSIEVGPSGMRLVLSYATVLFDAATARAMVEHLRVLLAGIVADPSRRLSRLPLLTPAEVHRELVEWNDTDAAHPVRCLHQSFEEQVARTPDGIAAVFEEERWTYAELDAHANRVARHLRGRDVAAETLVGVCMRPSLRRLACLLGIMKAGGGYVPLDPELPSDRLAYMVSDAGLRQVLVDDGAPELAAGVEAVDVDALWPALAGLPAGAPGHPVDPGSVVYVIYTSGSTGRPKGVVVEHATVSNYVAGFARFASLGPGHRCLQFASLSFDVSVQDMFATLCAGATAVFGSTETLHSPPRLADLMRRHRVTFACLPPAVVSLLADQPLPDLRVLFSAGEALSSDLLRSWLRPGLRFCNGYGPTEATCGVTLMELDAATPLPPPIGRPLSNYRAYVLDAHLNPVPRGALGELHVGGPVLARGYLGQPGLTGQRFIPDPFSRRPGARLYRTGDLVRRLPDGSIQFVGRADTQVKIRGVRVELGEIEAALASHPAVAQALIVVADDAAGQRQLIGYTRVEPGAARPPAADLRQHLARQLPASMVPAHLVLLDAFPLTASGKIDQRALPTPDTAARAGATPPRTLLETLLVDDYASLLGRQDLGIDDGFFDLGGSSLEAMRLIARLAADLGVDADVGAIFLAPTPRQLAALLRERYGIEDAEVDEDAAPEAAG
jgi:amino acid adenylation domain-containing protein